MLLNLHVKNLAIIDEVDVEFMEGLNILTGETGAGKSIIIGSINLCLGAKLKGDIVRQGCDCAIVQLVFSVDEEIKEKLQVLDINVDDDEVIITRKISSNGRSTCKINSQIVNLTTLSLVAAYLIDIHGQHDNQLLLNKKTHLDIIDEYGKVDISKLKNELKIFYGEYRSVLKQLNELTIDEDKKMREISLCRYELEEIENARLIEGEDDEVEVLFKRLNATAQISESLSDIEELMETGNLNASDCVLRAIKQISSVVGYDAQLQQLNDMLYDIQAIIGDFNNELSSYIAGLETDSNALVETEKRLDLINMLKSKYGKTIEEIKEYGKNCAKRLELLENQEEYVATLKIKEDKLYRELEKKADELSKCRKTWADKLCKEIREALLDLNFLDVKFETEFLKNDNIDINGYDAFQFMISTNPGQTVAPLTRIASGGELSRIMLAIKSVMSENEKIHTQIFDEIDAGISGRTAQMVAEKLSVIGKHRQVICITHLPQIAAMADYHFLIEKKVKEDEKDALITNTHIRPLNGEEIIEELARILGGAKITNATLESAREMKELASSVKRSK